MKSYSPFILIAISIAIYFVYISPAYKNVQTLRVDSSRSELVLQTAKDIVVKRDNLLTQYNNISPDSIKQLKVAIPEKFNSISLLSYINSIVSRYGMSLKDIKVSSANSGTEGIGGPKVIVSPYKTSTIGFSVSGTYRQFLSLLGDLQSSLYLFDVTSLSIKTGETKPGVSSVSDYSIEFTAYSLN